MSTRSFVFGMADTSGLIDAGRLYDVAEAVGYTSTQVRLAMRRMVAAGLIEIAGRGRHATIELTGTGHAERVPDLVFTAAAYRADAGLDSWDQRWHLVAFEIPESERPARDALRNQIVALFGAQITGGLYLSAFAWEPWIRATASAHGVENRVTYAQTHDLAVRGLTEPAAIAAATWPVDSLNRRYHQYLDRWRNAATSPVIDEIHSARTVIEATAELEDIMRHDPLLPAELVPHDFGGPGARALFQRVIAHASSGDRLGSMGVVEAYNEAIATALAQPASVFWRRAVDQTAMPGPTAQS